MQLLGEAQTLKSQAGHSLVRVWPLMTLLCLCAGAKTIGRVSRGNAAPSTAATQRTCPKTCAVLNVRITVPIAPPPSRRSLPLHGKMHTLSKRGSPGALLSLYCRLPRRTDALRNVLERCQCTDALPGDHGAWPGGAAATALQVAAPRVRQAVLPLVKGFKSACVLSNVTCPDWRCRCPRAEGSRCGRARQALVSGGAHASADG